MKMIYLKNEINLDKNFPLYGKIQKVPVSISKYS